MLRETETGQECRTIFGLGQFLDQVCGLKMASLM